MVLRRSTLFDKRRKRPSDRIADAEKRRSMSTPLPEKQRLHVCTYVYTLKFRKYSLNFDCEKRHVTTELLTEISEKNNFN